MGGLEFLLQTSVLSYLGENHPQNASESWIAGVYLIIHEVEQSSGKALSHLQWVQQRVLAAEGAWKALPGSAELHPAALT